MLQQAHMWRSEDKSVESFHWFCLCVYSRDPTQVVRLELFGSNCLRLLNHLADPASFGAPKVLVFCLFVCLVCFF